MAELQRADWLLRDAVVPGHDAPVDIAIRDGRILAIDDALPHIGRDERTLSGHTVLPGLVDAHVHLDKTYAPFTNESGTLGEAIEVWKANKGQFTREDYLKRGLRAVRQAVLHGVTAMRSHVDASGDLMALEALLELKTQVAPMLELQLVALGNAGSSRADTDAVRAALELGADAVGGAPALTDNPETCIRTTLELAEQFGKPVDLHIDETEDPQARTLETLADEVLARDFPYSVTAGHCCSLDFMEDEAAARVMDKVARANINIITLPACNLVLLGRGRHPVPRGLTRVKDLLACGVNVTAASDNVHDPFNPLGHYDPLFTANLTAHAAHLTGADELVTCLEMVTTHAAKVMSLEGYGLGVGAPADLVVLSTKGERESVADAVTTLPPRLATFKQGRCVVRQRHTVDWNVDWNATRLEGSWI